MKTFKQVLSLCLLLSIMLSLSVTAFATGDTTKNSVGSVPEDITNIIMVGQDETQNKESVYDYVDNGNLGDEHDVEVYVSKASTYTVMIPKTIILDGQNGIGEYAVAVKGDIEGMKQITIAPYKDAETPLDANNKLVLKQTGKTDITALVIQDDQTVVYDDLLINEYAEAATLTGTITAEGLSAGSWYGSFLMHISYDDISNGDSVIIKETLNDYTWAEIQTIAQTEDSLSTYNINIGDTKTDENGNVYYLVSDNRITAYSGLVFMYKSKLVETMNEAFPPTSEGGYLSSDLKKVVDNEFNNLPTDLQATIKPVYLNNYKGDNTWQSYEAYLFVPALREVSTYVPSYGDINVIEKEGDIFDWFNNPEEEYRRFLLGAAGWWLRTVESSASFWCVSGQGTISTLGTHKALTVVPAFVIG